MYDGLNRLDKIKDSSGQIIADYTYDELSRRTQLDLQNGTKTTYQYDQISRLKSLVNKVSATDAIISSFAYSNDKVGNRKSMSTTEGTHSYTYDKIYQVEKADYPSGYSFPDMTYKYDAVGNKISTINGGTIAYETNNMNQYTKVGGIDYTYDANGNLTSNGINTYIYDFDNRLIQVTAPTGTINYTYDSFGRRISKTDSNDATKYYYDGAQVIMETDKPGNVITTYAYGTGIDEVLNMTSGGNTYTYHLNGLGSIKELTDATGAIIEKYKYDVYGQPYIFDGLDNLLTESSVGNSYMFTGRKFDKDTGLYYYRARYYDAQIGRFLTPDPIGFACGDLNLYRYVRNNPINYVDPLGLCEEDGIRYFDKWFFISLQIQAGLNILPEIISIPLSIPVGALLYIAQLENMHPGIIKEELVPGLRILMKPEQRYQELIEEFPEHKGLF